MLTLCICFYYYCSAFMDDWDVSAVTSFVDIFKSLSDFNEPIGKWDVSSGTNFVSIDQSVCLQR
jgi:hypothetical protein